MPALAHGCVAALLMAAGATARASEPGPWPTARFTPPPSAQAPAVPLEGRLHLEGLEAAGFRLHRDDYGVAAREELALRRLPALALDLVSDGRHLIPRQRDPQPGDHPYWRVLPEPGLAWRVAGAPGSVRVMLSFALQERNQNCVHYGLLTFQLNPDGEARDLVWQVASETCAYLKFDAWGVAPPRFLSATVPDAARLRAAYAAERERRLPVRPVADLAGRQGLDLEALAPPFPGHNTVWGVVLDGVHYRSACPTRQGPHPACELVTLPSYSTAKGLFAGLSWLHLAHRWPELTRVEVPELVPECALPDGRWDGVRLSHLADMATGNFEDDGFQVDEDSERMATFFLATTNHDKLRFACEAWPRRAEPGTRPVYHTSDTYLLGVALQRWLAQQAVQGADLYEDVFLGRVLAPLEPGPRLATPLRTADAAAQPLAGYGLFLHPDDVARIGLALQDDRFLGERVGPEALEKIRFRDRAAMTRWPLSRGEGYVAGWWGFDLAPWIGCEAPVWVPFLSGYGGIRWALPPGGAVYYFFSDGGHGPWMDALIELARLNASCTRRPAA